MKLSKQKVLIFAILAVCIVSAIAILVSKIDDRSSKPPEKGEARKKGVPSSPAFSDTGQESVAKSGDVDVPATQPEPKTRIEASSATTRETAYETDNAGSDEAEAIEKVALIEREEALEIEKNRLSQFSENKKIRQKIEHFKDASIPLKKRLAELDRLAKNGDSESAKALMAIGDSAMYLSRHAIERLGHFRDREVAAYLATKLNHADATLAAAAGKAIAKAMQRKATPYLNTMILENRQRPDGHEYLVRRAAIKAMVSIHAKDGVPVLKSELKSARTGGWDLEYGSTVVNAISQLGEKSDAQALERYASYLESVCPEEPMPKQYYMSKIKEARQAADLLKS